MTDLMEMKVFIAALAKEVILVNRTPVSPATFNRDFAKIYDFLVEKLVEK